MANIRKRGRRYQAQVRRKGFPATTRTFSRMDEARAWARKQEIALDRAEAGIYQPSEELLSTVLERYKREVTPFKKSAASEIRRLERLLRDPVSRVRVCDLTSKMLSGFRDRRMKDGMRAAAYDLQLIRHALRIAEAEWGVSVRIDEVFKIAFPPTPKPRERRLRNGEYELLVEDARRSKSIYLAPLIVLAVETGMRLGEMLSMRWEDHDENGRTIRLPDTKNGEGRLVPLSATASLVLSNLSRDDMRIIPSNYSAVKSAWVRLCQRTGVENLRFHDLRHEAISRWFEKGFTVPEVAMISGHRTKTMLLRYAHADIERIKARLE